VIDQIEIKDLHLRTIIGINPEERRARQDVLVNIVLHADTRAAGASDDIADAVNYRTITKRVIALVEESGFCLVEKMVAEIAALCLQERAVQAVDVRVEKPGALRFARSVGVAIHRTQDDLAARPNRVFVSLGANIEPEQNLPEAANRLASRCTLVAASPVYETPPIGPTEQPAFLNAAALIETYLDAGRLKAEVLRAIEDELCRVRTADRNAPRTIDLDISLFNAEIFELDGRHIPDPDVLHYAHVAVPLADLAPDMRHPETGQTLRQIAQTMTDRRMVRRIDVWLYPRPDTRAVP
jgi:2-amino-4-hydroxy-6-hydroxymethyldihydropteridine diphosphokinase